MQQDESQDEKQPIQALIAVGELEKHHFSGMNANAQVFVDELAPCRELGMRVEFYEFEGESHISVLPVLISRAVRFALKSGEAVE
ncbi:Ferri-bacillibactin esterase BesA [compost metagenome]